MFDDIINSKMFKHFTLQMKYVEKPVTKEILQKLNNEKSIYSNFKIGDIIFIFMTIRIEDNIEVGTFKNVAKREINKLTKDFEFVEMKGLFPILKKIPFNAEKCLRNMSEGEKLPKIDNYI